MPKKVFVTLNDETSAALEEIATRRRAPLASVIRDGVELLLKQEGYDVDTRVSYGGKRDTKSKGEG